MTCKTKCHHAYYTDAKIEEIYLAWNNAGRHGGLTTLRKTHGPVFSRRLNYNIVRLDQQIDHKKRGPKPKAVAVAKAQPKRVVEAAPPVEAAASVLERMDDTTLNLYVDLRRSRSGAMERIGRVTKEIESLYASIQTLSLDLEAQKKFLSETEHDIREVLGGL